MDVRINTDELPRNLGATSPCEGEQITLGSPAVLDASFPTVAAVFDLVACHIRQHYCVLSEGRHAYTADSVIRTH
jgi:hypothetical protein